MGLAFQARDGGMKNLNSRIKNELGRARHSVILIPDSILLTPAAALLVRPKD
jgi:hypothetical protein